MFPQSYVSTLSLDQGVAIINLYTYPHILYVLYVCMYMCKKTIFSGLHCFRVHCATLIEEKNNDSDDNKLALVIINPQTVFILCV